MASNPLPKKVAAELRSEMAWQQRSVTEMADAMGLDRKAAKRRYDGEKPMTLDEVEFLASWLQVPIERLLVGRVLPQAVAS